MKAAKFLLVALVLGINAISYAQNPYPPINAPTFSVGSQVVSQTKPAVDSIKQARVQALINSGKADSIAKLPATGPVKDSASVLAKDSVKADTSASAAAINPPASKADGDKTAGTKPRESEIGINQRWGLNGTLWTWILVILGCAILMLFRTSAAKALGGTVKSWFTKRDSVAAETEAAEIKKIRDDAFALGVNKNVGIGKKVINDICQEKIDLDNKKHISNFKKLMIFFRDYSNPWMRRLRYAGIFALGCGLLFVLFIFAKSGINIKNEYTILPAAVTPSVVSAPDTLIVEDPVPAYREPVSNRDNQTVARTAADQAMNVYVPSEGDGKPVYTKWGDANELSEKSGYYQVVIKPGYHFKAQALDGVRLILSNGSFVDYGPNDFVDLANSGLNGKIRFASLNKRATNVAWTIEPN